MSANPSPKVSVIVPIYKVEQYLMPCLETIVTQTLRDLEIILVDEGDHDVCYAIMKLYESEDSRVKVIHQKCGSYGNAVNLAIDAAQGEYIAIVEPDDLLEPTMYEELYKIAREADADIAKCSYSEYRAEHGTATKRPAHEPFLRSVPAGGFTIKDYPQL